MTNDTGFTYFLKNYTWIYKYLQFNIKFKGTGIVHTAPAFGADDYKVAVQYKIIRPDDPPCPVDDNGRFTAKVKDYEG